MKRDIPDELGVEIAEIAAGLNLGVDDAIRDALQRWVNRMRPARGRLPDPPIVDDMITAPFELPRSAGRRVVVTRGPGRIPDGVGLT